MKIGILTGGGDCPGLNAVIRAVVRKGVFHYDDQFVGFMEGWRGLVEDKSMELDLDAVSGILPRGGTILRTSRTNPSKRPDGFDRCMKTIATHKIDALVAIGGDDTLSVAQKLHEKGVQSRWSAEDDRQRPGWHRLHLRLRYRVQHRLRGDRPRAHHCRSA